MSCSKYIIIVLLITGCGGYVSEMKRIDAKGVVVKKYPTDPGCFGDIVIKDHSTTDTIKRICYCVVEEQKVYDYVIPGDSIYKKEGSLVIKVVRNGVAKNFDFPMCGR